MKNLAAQPDLMAMLELDVFSKDTQKKLLDRIGDILEQRLLMKARELLSEAQQEELKRRMLEDGDGLSYLETHIDNFEEYVAEEVHALRKDLFSKKEALVERVEERT